MGQPSSDWIAEQDRADRDLVVRYTRLDDVLRREGARLRDAEVSADLLDRIPTASSSGKRQEIADRRQLMAIASHVLANLDRAYLLERPARRERRQGGGR
ncbi:hypothetical protein [uncultured Methylobacterium sp.]|uniref:hypothetical protein n=1 Tax=uncultured Methylobacterium sp. TaxID=157278 RepID=UPI0035C95674